MSDYIRELHRLSGELLLLHGDLLKNKNIHRRGDLARTIRLDLDKLAEVLIEVRDKSAPEVLGHARHDRSFHTKIVRPASDRMELEFVAG